jgi:tRNA threonylcarbamoyl adenosine modification protein YeaZ
VPRYTLAIETSNPSSGPRGIERGPTRSILRGPGVALGPPNAAGAYDAEPLHEGTRHDDDLMPAIDRLLRRNDASPRDLARVAVSIGPGGYTGLRIAVATAKMIAEATGAQTVAVPSALVAAWSLPFSAAPALVCLGSKGQTAHATLLPLPLRESPWWGEHGSAAVLRLIGVEGLAAVENRLREGKSWIAAACELGILGPDQMAALQPRTLIADSFLPPVIRSMAASAGIAVLEPVFAAESVLDLAAGLPPIDPIALAPLYPREPEAVTLWRARKP